MKFNQKAVDSAFCQMIDAVRARDAIEYRRLLALLVKYGLENGPMPEEFPSWINVLPEMRARLRNR